MSVMQKLFVWNTDIGLFYIAEMDGRFHPLYEDQSLGSYERPQQAAEGLAGGQTVSIRGGVDTSTLGIPEDIRGWQRVALDPTVTDGKGSGIFSTFSRE